MFIFSYNSSSLSLLHLKNLTLFESRTRVIFWIVLNRKMVRIKNCDINIHATPLSRMIYRAWGEEKWFYYILYQNCLRYSTIDIFSLLHLKNLTLFESRTRVIFWIVLNRKMVRIKNCDINIHVTPLSRMIYRAWGEEKWFYYILY